MFDAMPRAFQSSAFQSRAIRTAIFAFAAGLLPIAPSAFAQSLSAQPPARVATTPQGTIELIVGDVTPDRGGKIAAGLRFKLKQGWHIYWQNPGDSGGPPKIAWTLPTGVTAGPFDFPTPHRIPLEPMMNFGYEGDVVLPFTLQMASVTTTLTSKPVADAQAIDADVRWLVCKDICVSVRSRLSLALPITEAERGQLAEWRKVIDQAASNVPRPAPETWRSSARATKEGFVVTLDLDRAVAAQQVVFFPIEEHQIENAAPQKVEISGRRVTIHLEKSAQIAGAPDVLPGVITLDGGRGHLIKPRVTSAPASPVKSPK
jgi:DsbC/DsbD-like thiol-disulfide interchange protein